ncbi:MAG: aldehyde dehydrogenase family protein, partial [Mesorhizobium sp.]
MTLAKETASLLEKLGVTKDALSGGDLIVRSPVTGEQIAALKQISAADAGKAIDAAHKAFQA